MYLVAPEILADGRGLSLDLCIAGIVIGLFLWMWGWWSYRFLLVLTTTTLAGLLGLAYGKTHGIHPMVTGLVFAGSAGYLALSLARLFAFIGGGFTACLLVAVLIPRWEEPLLCFLVGGFLGLVLVRYWMMAVTSLVGTLLTAYSTLWLLDRLGKIDAAAWTESRVTGLNWAILAASAVGFLIQFYLDRRKSKRDEANAKEEAKGKEVRSKAWWQTWQSPTNRKAA